MTTRVSTRMVHWGIRLVSLGFALGFFALSRSAVEARCDQIVCRMGVNGCAADEHYTFQTFFGTRQGEAHTECIQATCDANHPQCTSPLPAGELDELERAAMAGETAKVEAMLSEYRSLTVNVERSALQQLDCSGEVLAHIPVPSTLINDLSAVGQR